MNRRGVLMLGVAALAGAAPAFAKDIVADIVGQLEARGYDQISVSRTWLGRARIVAKGARGSREIIVNPATGEILRDLSEGSVAGGGLLEAGGDSSGKGDDSGDDGGDDGGGDDGGGDDGGGDDGGGDDGGDHSGHGGGDGSDSGDD